MPSREFEFSDSDFLRVKHLIHQQAGILLSESKKDLVYSRLGKRLRKHSLRRFVDYLAMVDRDSEERVEFVNALTTNLTAFFREPHHFETLANYFASKKGPIKVWCGAASTGEEPYSIAMTAVESFASWTPPVSILATDLDTNVLAVASQGIYPVDRLKEMDSWRTRTFFLRGINENQNKAKVRTSLQRLVRFRCLNLLSENWELPESIDIIFLRNVFIYFDKATQLRILERCRQYIRDDGLLFIGHSESLTHATHLFKLSGRTVYRPFGEKITK